MLKTKDLYVYVGLALALGYLIIKAVFDASDTVDFKYIYLAGQLWLEGENPYSDVYLQTGKQLFSNLNAPTFWVYPPNWWPVSSLVSFLPYDLAAQLWRVLSALFLLLGSVVLIFSFDKHVYKLPSWLAALFIGLVITMSATAVTLYLGQTSALIFLGICCFLSAYITKNQTLMFFSIFIIMLKPTLGLMLCGLLASSLYWWRTLLIAALATILFCVPAFVTHGMVEVLSNYSQQLSLYGTVDVNMAHSMTGLRYLLFKLFDVETSSIMLTLAGSAVLFVINILIEHFFATENERQKLVIKLYVALSLLCLFIPMHSYDLIFITALLLLSVLLSKSQQLLTAIGFFVIYRSTNLQELLNFSDPQSSEYFQDTLLVSIAIIFFVVAAGISFTKHLKINLRNKTFSK